MTDSGSSCCAPARLLGGHALGSRVAKGARQKGPPARAVVRDVKLERGIPESECRPMLPCLAAMILTFEAGQYHLPQWEFQHTMSQVAVATFMVLANGGSEEVLVEVGLRVETNGMRHV